MFKKKDGKHFDEERGKPVILEGLIPITSINIFNILSQIRRVVVKALSKGEEVILL